MEARGLVNQYERYRPKTTADCGRIFTLNMACGVTPFMLLWEGREYSSNFYRVMVPSVVVTHVWRRPAREEFDELPEDQKMHVLNGGLLLGELGRDTLANDPARPEIQYEDWQVFCLRHYGRRLGPTPT